MFIKLNSSFPLLNNALQKAPLFSQSNLLHFSLPCLTSDQLPRPLNCDITSLCFSLKIVVPKAIAVLQNFITFPLYIRSVFLVSLLSYVYFFPICTRYTKNISQFKTLWWCSLPSSIPCSS